MNSRTSTEYVSIESRRDHELLIVILYPHSLSAFFITKVNFKGIAFSYAFKVDLCYKTVKKIHCTINSRAYHE